VIVVLDAGALVGIDKHDRHISDLLRELQAREVPLMTSAAVVAQVFRHGSRQARLARLLNDTKIEPLTEDAGRKIGGLLAKSKTSDVVDGHVALLLTDGDLCITSDPRDIKTLTEARDISAQILAV
jgi:hypothetical protein